MSKLKLYEFSSGVQASYNSYLGSWEFREYEVGQFMLNSFTLDSNIKKTSRGIPESIDFSIRHHYFKVKSPSYGKVALTGRYLDDNWVVLAVADQLAGRPNELYRFFCVQSKLTDEVDPMLFLIDWYIANKPRFDFDRDRDLQIRKISASSPYSKQVKSDREQYIIEALLTQQQPTESPNIDLKTEELRNIIAHLPIENRKSFTWALGASNFITLKSGKFNLVQNSEEILWIKSISSPFWDTSKEFIKKELEKLSNLHDSYQIFEIIKNLFECNFPQEIWKNVFDNMDLDKLMKGQAIKEKNILFLVIQAIFCPERITDLVNFYQDCKQYQNIIADFESKIRVSLKTELNNLSQSNEGLFKDINSHISKLLENLCEGTWICLNDSLNSHGNIKTSFLLREKENQSLWTYVLTNQVRIDFYNYLYNNEDKYILSKSAKTFFVNFQKIDEKLALDFLNFFGKDDPLIMTFGYKKKTGNIPRENQNIFDNKVMASVNKAINSFPSG